MTSSVDLGPVTVRQTKPYGCSVCGGDAPDKCRKGTFDWGFLDCNWPISNERKCCRPDPGLCKKVWPEHSSVAYKSGSSKNDARVSCTWKNIPADKITRPRIEKYLEEYGSETREARRGYNDLMAAYCFTPTSNCMRELGPGVCSKVHSGDAEERKFCGAWWDSIKGTKVGDAYLQQACPPNKTRSDCKCVNASRADNTPFHELASKIPFPSTCWYNPCRTSSTNSQFRSSAHEGVLCSGQVCLNIANLNVDAEAGAYVQDSDFSQSQSCVLNQTAEATAVAASEPSPPSNDDEDLKRVGIALGIGVLIIAAVAVAIR